MTPYQLNKTDSRFFGHNMVTWQAGGTKDIEELVVLEKEIQQKFEPAMVTAFLPVNETEKISWFSAVGYHFIECRLQVQKELQDEQSSFNLYPYEFVEVANRSHLNQLLKTCSQLTFDDRFFNDPEIDNDLALQRNLFFLKQSFRRKNEFIFALQNSNSERIEGFRSFKTNSPTEASMLITGIIPEKQKENIQELINLFELEKLSDMNIRKVNAVISVQNYDEINRYIAKYGYTIYDSKILLRKILKPFQTSDL